MSRPVILVLGPAREAISGVTTHVNLLLGSAALARDFSLVHFQVGSEGRREGVLARLLRLLASPFALAAAIARGGAGIVHVNTSLNVKAYWRDLAYVLTAKLCGARVVYQTHGGALHAFCPPGSWLRRVVRATLKWPDVVVVISRQELEAMRALVPGLNVVLLPNAIDVEPFLRQGRPAPDPQAPLALLYLGRLARTKGIFEALAALDLARNRGVAARLVIAGGGPEEAPLREEVRRRKLEDRVRFFGPAFGEDKAKLLATAEVLMLPTYHLEGLPYALLEGMAAGLVPVVTRIGAIPDVVSEGVHGLFVPPRDPMALADAIGALAADREYLAAMGAACRRHVGSAYSIERLAADFSALYLKWTHPNPTTWRRTHRRA